MIKIKLSLPCWWDSSIIDSTTTARSIHLVAMAAAAAALKTKRSLKNENIFPIDIIY